MHHDIGSLKWPADPYKGLANYECEDQRLFAGRDAEIDACAQLLANAQTKLLILHGQTGCGKSSFLRAGLIPSLEQNGAGYLFLKRRSVNLPSQWEPSFIRCGADPLSRIAEEIFKFTAEPLHIKTAIGLKEIDLTPARLGIHQLEEFVAACADPHQLWLALDRLTGAVPHTLVLVLDQVEEVITLNSSNTDNRSRFARFIKELATSDIDMRFVLAIRKDHSGQFIGSIQIDNEISLAFRTFFLSDLSRGGIREAILRPTLKSLPADPAAPGPFEHYQFEFATGIVEQILNDLDKTIPAGATLPVMQIVCRNLYEQVSQLPAPRIIEARLYTHGGGIKGRIKRHVTRSLSKVLNSIYERGNCSTELQLKWLRLLQTLVQEEGDGRVHTDVVPMWILKERAVGFGISGDIGPIVDRLTDPKILILRKFTVFAPGATSEKELLCLGHDMVGIALGEALRDAEANRFVSSIVRKRIGQVALFFLIISAIAAIAVNSKIQDNLERTAKIRINGLLERSSNSRTSNVLASIVAAKEAQEISASNVNNDKRPTQLLARLLSGLPIIVSSRQSAAPPIKNSDIFPTYPLPERIGFATLRSGGILETYRVKDNSIQEHTFSTPEPLRAVDGNLALQWLDFSEASTNLLLAMYKPPEGKGLGGVAAFSRTYAPKLFSQAELANMLDGVNPSTDDIKLFALSGNSIILYQFDADPNYIRLRSLDVSDTLELKKSANFNLEKVVPTTQINGHHVLSFFHSTEEKNLDGVPSRPLIKVEAMDILPNTRPREWRTADFRSVKSCVDKKDPGQPCEVTAVLDIQQTNLVTLALWRVTNGRYGSYRRGFISHLIIIDLESSVVTEVDLRTAAAARQACGHAGLDYPAPGTINLKEDLSDDDVPAFLFNGPDGLVLGYSSRTYAQLINTSFKSSPCREIFFPESRIGGWRASDGGKKLLAFTRNGGFVWDIIQKVEATSDGVNKEIMQACAGKLNEFDIWREEAEIGNEVDNPRARYALKKNLMNRICN